MALPAWDTGAVGPELTSLSPWDTLVLGGVTLPGRATIRAHRGRKHDRRRPGGVDGEEFCDLGSQVAELEITITVWNSEQMDKLVQALDRLLPVPKKIKQLTPQQKAQVNQVFPISPLVVDGIRIPDSTPTATSPGESLHALTIYHPSLARLRVRNVLIIEEENFQQGHEAGTFEWRCRAVEWMGTGKGSVVAKTDGAVVDSDPSRVPVVSSLQVDTPSSTDSGP